MLITIMPRLCILIITMPVSCIFNNNTYIMYNDNDNDNACIMYIDDNNPWVVDSIYNLIEAAVGLEHE